MISLEHCLLAPCLLYVSSGLDAASGYMEVPSFKGDIGIHTGLYIHNHILHFSSLALFSLLALLN